MKRTDQKTALKAIKKEIRSHNENSLKAEKLALQFKQESSAVISINNDDKKLFSDAVAQVKPLVIDTIHPTKKSGKHNQLDNNKKNNAQQNKALAQFHFSDEFEPNLNKQGPMKYLRDGVDSFEVKNLRRGYYRPDLILDLHGLDQHQAKKELAALLYACQKEHAQCICIVHGIGSHILKNKVPHWLVQHPDVMAFHQAPLEWGGDGALLALIELKDKYLKG
jgi:DNA-nicking Smr family endonuclease